MGTYTTAGLAEVMVNGHQYFSHVAVGDGTAAESESATALDNQVEIKARGGYINNGATAVISAFFTNGEANPSGGYLKEVGIFDAASGGTLLWREKLSTVRAKDNSEGAIVDCSMSPNRRCERAHASQGAGW
jgi:hypothetical protein